jgi:Uma2 family endonuclease
MAIAAAERLITAEDLFHMPDNGCRYELVKGELIRMAPAGARHGEIASRLDRRLGGYVEAQGLGVVCATDTGFRLAQNPDTVRAPDVSFVARERIPAEGVPEQYWPFAPDLAVEVVSPSDSFDEVAAKVSDYLAAGTRLVWIVHPRTRTVMIYRATGEVRLLQPQEELSGEDVIPGFSCRVEELFV